MIDYYDEFDPLPMEEISRLMREYRRPFVSGKHDRWSNLITICDIEKECKIHHLGLQAICEQRPMPDINDCRYFGRKRRQKLGRWLLKAACGMIIKKDGKIVYLDEPTKPMPIVKRVVINMNGPSLVRHKQLEAPRSIPKFLDVFKCAKVIQLPRIK